MFHATSYEKTFYTDTSGLFSYHWADWPRPAVSSRVPFSSNWIDFAFYYVARSATVVAKAHGKIS